MSSNQLSPEQAADQAAASGDFEQAIGHLEDALAAQSDRPGLWVKLSAMRRAAGDLTGALNAVDRALALQPLDFSALLSRAILLDRAGDQRAGEAYCNAVAQAPDDDDIPPPMRAAVAAARERSQAHQTLLGSRLTASIGHGAKPSSRARLDRFVSNIVRRTRTYHQEPSHFHYPGLPEIEFHDPREFPGLTALEEKTDSIRAEFQALLTAEAAELVPYINYPDQAPLRQWQALNHNRDWSALHLIQNGQLIEANARHCPVTMAALADLPQPWVAGACPNAMFSLLAPATRIPPHSGVANTRLVCHLPLIVPAGCGFRVGDSQREWRAGEAFVFDDTIEHEAWNDSNELRVVLIFDLWPPALGQEERAAVARVIAAAGVGFTGTL